MENEQNWKASSITDAQRKKLFALLSEHKIDKDIFEGATAQKISELTKGDASECIDILINAEDKIGSLRLWALGNDSQDEMNGEPPNPVTPTSRTTEKKESKDDKEKIVFSPCRTQDRQGYF